jgi:hypothetical protein
MHPKKKSCFLDDVIEKGFVKQPRKSDLHVETLVATKTPLNPGKNMNPSNVMAIHYNFCVFTKPLSLKA